MDIKEKVKKILSVSDKIVCVSTDDDLYNLFEAMELLESAKGEKINFLFNSEIGKFDENFYFRYRKLLMHCLDSFDFPIVAIKLHCYFEGIKDRCMSTKVLDDIEKYMERKKPKEMTREFREAELRVNLVISKNLERIYFS